MPLALNFLPPTKPQRWSEIPSMQYAEEDFVDSWESLIVGKQNRRSDTIGEFN